MRPFLPLIQTAFLLFIGALTAQTQNGCTDSLACNYDAAATNDDGSCTYNYWIPTTLNTDPLVIDCENPDPNLYFLGHQTCLAQLVIDDPYCVNTSWDGVCLESYEECLIDCPQPKYWIPFELDVLPMAYSCTAPSERYYEGATNCASELWQNYPSTTTIWTATYLNQYNNCLLNCTDASWHIPIDPQAAAVQPIIYDCDAPIGYWTPEQSCLLEFLTEHQDQAFLDWNTTLQMEFNQVCLGCPDAKWAVPFGTYVGDQLIFDGPAVFTCNPPGGYVYLNDEDYPCLLDIIESNPWCTEFLWDQACQDMLDFCICQNQGLETYWLPYSAYFSPPAHECMDPGNDYFPANPSCLNEVFELYPEAQSNVWTPEFFAAYYACELGCADAQWYIPNIVGDGPALLSCPEDAPASHYAPVDQVCVTEVIQSNDECLDLAWSSNCHDQFMLCQYGCENPLWHIPFDWQSNSQQPAIFACDVPEGYWTPTQFCVEGVIASLPDQGTNDWNEGGQELYNNICLGCPDASWYIPNDTGTAPLMFSCFQHSGYSEVISFDCLVETFNAFPNCLTDTWNLEYQTHYFECFAYGCSYEWACNYSPMVTQDDGSCEKAGCTDPNALNYELDAGCDDGSCLYPNDCAADFDSNGSVNASDLLNFLSLFGSMCE